VRTIAAATTPVAAPNQARPSANVNHPNTPSARKASSSNSVSPAPNSENTAPTSVASGCGVGAKATS
jgi:hypothetical protein